MIYLSIYYFCYYITIRQRELDSSAELFYCTRVQTVRFLLPNHMINNPNR